MTYLMGFILPRLLGKMAHLHLGQPTENIFLESLAERGTLPKGLQSHLLTMESFALRMERLVSNHRYIVYTLAMCQIT